MLPVKKSLQLSILALVCISGLLLGLSQGNWRLSLIAIVGGTAGYLITDWLHWFHLRGWLANFASLLILFYAMKDFVDGDSAVKLMSVANLLVYLQTLLMFQPKTPRLYWQIMVLSLLQVVVAAIFNLNFEGGVLFLAYFAIAGLTMILQTLFTVNCDIQNRNRRAAERLRRELEQQATRPAPTAGTSLSAPIVVFNSRQAASGVIGRIATHLLLWLGASLMFATILFYMIPRSTAAWFGPAFSTVTGTGIDKSVDLEHDDFIQLTGEIVCRAWFVDPASGKKVELSQSPYFRGLALSSWGIKDGRTNWTAPHDRVYPFVYHALPKKPDSANRYLRLQMVIQDTNDPLLYACMPAYQTGQTPSEVEFCQELSALSRRRNSEQIELAPFRYETFTLLDRAGRPLSGWPYQAEDFELSDKPMSENPGQFKWLTHCDPSRYPTLVSVATAIAQRVPVKDNLTVARALEQHFLDPANYQYSLDFRDIQRDPALDPVEDFVGNYKRGHCELFASALTLMLRSQNIPARLVVGFHGGEFNQLTSGYMIRSKHAHAWVEAYLPPADCTAAMFESGAASPGSGCWLVLDPTPTTTDLDASLLGSGDALELARTLWQDYVLGLDASRQPMDVFGMPSSSLLGLLDLSNWGQTAQRTLQQFNDRPLLQVLMIGLVLLLTIAAVARAALVRNTTTKRLRSRKSSRLRQLVGGALSIISPQLARWVLQHSTGSAAVPFYHRLATLLGKHGLTRQTTDTHREFANQVAVHFGGHPQADSIRTAVHQITDWFYLVRFGEAQLDHDHRRQIDHTLLQLEKHLNLE